MAPSHSIMLLHWTRYSIPRIRVHVAVVIKKGELTMYKSGLILHLPLHQETERNPLLPPVYDSDYPTH